jgi:hypothetical protein
MKLTKSDLTKIVKKVIKEQYSWGTGGHTAPKAQIQASKEAEVETTHGVRTVPCGKPGQPPCNQWTKEDTHNLLMMASLATAFIPVIGPFVSSGIQMTDAAIYYQEGNMEMAGMSAMFALIPGAGKLLSKIPILKNINPSLLKKWKAGTPVTQIEKEALDALGKNVSVIQKELGEIVVNQADELLKKPTLTQSAKTALTKITTNGLKFTVKTATTMAPYAVAGVAYKQAYDYAQSDTPSALSAKENIDWGLAKAGFGSSGSYEDNMKLHQAWKEGWRPGTVVPEKYRTLAYSKIYNEEQQKLKDLDAALAKYE